MRGTILSNCERNFILQAASELKRLDGRKLEGFRNLKVRFGQDWGLCHVSLGNTKVLTQVTCEIQEPKATRPNEGFLFINVELSSAAAPTVDTSRTSDINVHLTRLIEKCFKDSRAVDLESLCIVSDEKVWVLKIDVNILNNDGSLVDCASISVLAALAHFKRPDVTTDGVEIKVHSLSERDPIPITLHHYPVCVSFALLNNSGSIFADPTAIEEKVSDASLTFGINAYGEICCLHLGGIALTKPRLVLTCSTKAAIRAKEVVAVIKEELRKDGEARQLQKPVGFVDCFEWNKVTAISEDRLQVQLNKFVINKTSSSSDETEGVGGNFEIKNLGENCAELTAAPELTNGGVPEPTEESYVNNSSPPPRKFQKKGNNIFIEKSSINIGEGGPTQWKVTGKIPNPVTDSDSCSDHEKDEICEIPLEKKTIESIELSGDSEEEEVVILNPQDISYPQSSSKKRGPWPSKGSGKKSEGFQLTHTNQNVRSDKPKRVRRRRGNKRTLISIIHSRVQTKNKSPSRSKRKR